MSDNIEQPKPKKRVATKAQVRERLAFVETMRNGLCSRHQIIDAMRERYGISWRMTDIYMQRVEQRWQKEEALEDAKQRRLVLRRTAEALFRKAVRHKNLNVAARILEQLCKIEGVNAPERHRVEHAGLVGSVDVSNEKETHDRIRDLAARILKGEEMIGESENKQST